MIETMNRDGWESTEYFPVRNNPAVMAAIDGAIELVGSTYGPNGRNVLVSDSAQAQFDDGMLALQTWVPKDLVTRGIVERMLGAAKLQHSKYFDGTSSTILLTASLLKAGLGADEWTGKVLTEEVKSVYPMLVKQIRGISRPATEDYVVNAATVAAHGNEVLGKKIGTAMFKLGKWGVLQPRLHDGSEIEVEVLGGYSYESQVSRDMWNAPDGVRYNSAVLVLLQHELERESDPGFRKVLEEFAKIFHESEGRTALIFVGAGIKGAARAMIAKRTDVNGNRLPIAVVPPPGKDDSENLLFLQDMQAIFGGAVFSQTQGRNLQSFKGSVDFARVDEVYGNLSSVVFRSHTAHNPHGGAKSLAESAANQLELFDKKAQVGKDEKRNELLSRRLNALNGSLGRILIPTQSQGVVRSMAEVIDDASGAARAALEGVVPGGQSALIYAIQKTHMSDALRQALLLPARLIWGDQDVFVNGSAMMPSGDDAYAVGCLDATSSVVGALETAVLTAAEVINSKFIITKTF